MNLIQKQKKFTLFVAKLLNECERLGYETTFGEVWRPDETARIYAEKGIGIDNSVHRIRLAVDLNLFKDGKFLMRTSDYQLVGEYWESLSEEKIKCRWGGRWNDGNHFSIEHQGVK